MSEYDVTLPDDDLAKPIESEAAKKGLTREEAISVGARYGMETALQLGETGREREDRIQRAKDYAAWEYDGRPVKGAGYTGARK